MEMKNIKISNFISFGAYGSFSIFHYSNKLNEFALKILMLLKGDMWVI